MEPERWAQIIELAERPAAQWERVEGLTHFH